MSRASLKAWQHIATFKYYAHQTDELPAVLFDLQLLENAITDARRRIVVDMRADGASWGEVGDALGMSRQGARQKFS